MRSSGGLRRAGMATWRSPRRYFPVSDSASPSISSGVPAATSSPPWMPAPGPRSSTKLHDPEGVAARLEHKYYVSFQDVMTIAEFAEQMEEIRAYLD